MPLRLRAVYDIIIITLNKKNVNNIRKGVEIVLKYGKYRDKVEGCWLGKNIGGTFGAPTEGKSCMEFEKFYDFYLQDLNGEPIPNDDLDLQLVWLNAVEKYNGKINSGILGDYWLSYITPNPEEYGCCKANLERGLIPPLTGWVNNMYRNSCGAFIRSEIWACLAPGHPEIAVKYAVMDAEVDHAEEGIYAEVFCAAMESAAFVEDDINKILDIGLSYVPQNCGIRRAVESVRKSYREKLTWKEAFFELMRVEPSSFSGRKGWTDTKGNKIEAREVGYSASGNVGIALIGLIYGEGDFDKSLAYAMNCGEDTDCTVATIGAMFGVIYGKERIPKKWIAPIGTKISTCCINDADWTIHIPKDIDELTDRVCRASTYVLGPKYCNILSEGSIEYYESENLYYSDDKKMCERGIYDARERSPFKVEYNFEMMDVIFDYCEAPFFENNSTKIFKLKFRCTRGRQMWVDLKLYHDECVSTPQGDVSGTFMQQFYHAMTETEIEINIGECNKSKLDMVLELSIPGRGEKNYIPITLLRNNVKDVFR